MTSQEARQQVEICERQIIRAYDDMCSAARTVGTSAVSAASGKTVISTLLPLMISVIGLIFFVVHPFLAIILVAVGIWIAFKSYSRAKAIQEEVEGEQARLNVLLYDKAKI